MIDSVDQQPIRLYMAFSVAHIIGDQSMIPVRGWQWFLTLQSNDNSS